ncbi:MAG: AAA-like domain-containing protein [Trichodesmium sp.]
MKTEENQEYSYQVGSYLGANHPTYVRRSADRELFNALKGGEYCYVLSSPQTGKSSLKISTIELLEAENIICISLEMTRVNNQLLTLNEWYDQVILTLEKTFIFPRHFPELWWEETADIPTDEKLFIFIEEVLLTYTQNEKIVIFIDDVNDDRFVNSGLSSLGVLIDFCLQKRANNPDFKRLTFALLGTTIPNNLINVCKYIELTNFQIEEVPHFVNRFGGIVQQPRKVMEEILFWSGGQPFLTQKLCQIVINYLGDRAEEENYNDVALIEDLVKICVVENWDAQDFPPHISKIKNLLLRNIQESTSHLEIYQQLLKYGRLKPPGENNQRFKNDAIATSKWEIKELLRSGVAKISQGFLEIYSPIYAEIFNEEWVAEYLGKITLSEPIINQQKVELDELNTQEISFPILENQENYQIQSNGVIQPPPPQFNNLLELESNNFNSQVNSLPVETNISNNFNSQVNNFPLETNTSNLENQETNSNDLIKPLEKKSEITKENISNQNKQDISKRIKKHPPNYQNKLQIGVAGLAIIGLVTMAGIGWATKIFQDKQNQLQTAEYQLEKAQYELQEAQTGTQLERKGINSIRQFEVAEIEGLLSATQTGKELQELVKGGRPLQYYPATSPIFALQQILQNIHEKNQIPNIKNIAISPDNQLLGTVSNDGTAKILKFSGQPVAQLRGHQGKISQIKFAPQGDIVATTADDGTARIWDYLGKQQVEMKGHEGQIWQISFSPDGKLLATAGEDGTANIWDISGKKIATLKQHKGRILDITFSPDGKYVATAGWDGTARIWSRSGRQLARLRGHQGSVEKVIFSPDGKRLATAGWDGTIRIWWRRSGKLLAKLKGGIWNISFSPDSERFATGGEDGTASIWDASGKLLAKLPGHEGIVTSISFSPDGQRLVTAGSNGDVKLWSNNGNLLTKLRGHQGRVWETNFSADGQVLLTLGEDGTGRIWQLQRNYLAKIQGGSDIFRVVSFSPTSQKLATAAIDGTMRIWDISGKPLARFNGYLGMFGDISFSPDGQRLATAGDNGQARIWQISGEELTELEGKEGRAKQISFGVDGQRLVTVGEDGIARVWDNSGQQLAELKGHSGRVLDVGLSQDGKYIGTAGEDGIAKVWNSSFQVVLELKVISSWIESIAFSSSGDYIATGDSNGIVKVWDFSGNEIVDLKAHIGSVEDLTFSADGEKIITMGKDEIIKVWDINGRQIAQFENAQGLSMDGKYVATFTDNNLQLWEVKELDDLLTSSCNWLGDYFVTHPEVKEYLQICQ